MLAWLVPELSFSPRIKRRVGFRGNPEEIEFAGDTFGDVDKNINIRFGG